MLSEPEKLTSSDVHALIRAVRNGELPERQQMVNLLGDTAGELTAHELRVVGALVRKAIAGHADDDAAARDLRFYLELIANQPHFLEIVRDKAAAVQALFECARDGKRLPPMMRATFGVLSSYHERALVAAILDGTFTEADALECVDRGDEVTKRIGAHAFARVPLRFRTVSPEGNPDTPADFAEMRVDDPLEVATRGRSFQLLVSSECELRQSAVRELDTVSWLDRTLESGSVFYDVGANIGVYSLYAASVCADVRVVAFEPAPLNFARLAANIYHNKAPVLAFPLGIADREGVSSFRSNHMLAGAWSHAGIIDGTDADAGLELKTGCVLTTIDQFVTREDMPQPTHLKVDVDGAELLVLRGADRTLSGPTLRHVMIEIQDDRGAAHVTKWMIERGYKPLNPDLRGFGNRFFEKVVVSA